MEVGLQRRVLFAAVIFLMFIYVLCWNLGPLLHFQDLAPGTSSGAQASEEPPMRLGNGDRRNRLPPAATVHPNLSPGAGRHQRTPATRGPAPNTQTWAAVKQQNVEGNKEETDSDDMGATTGRSKGPTQAARPTEPPFIGDEYLREGIPAPTGCSDAIRGRVGETEFGQRFLEDIPVLQWAAHVNRVQYERLSKYPGAHGWGGIDYKTLEETLSVLNSSANGRMLDDWKDRGRGSTCIRCAVVGNGGILKDSKRGEEIDGHHYVFRTNGAIITGFEADVGSRTTHYTFSTNTLMNSMRSYAKLGYRGPPVSKETRYIFLPDHDRDYLLMKAAATNTPVERGREHGKDPSVYFGKDVSKEKLKMYHPDFIRYLRNRFLRSNALKTKYKDIYRPSTGAVMLLAALHTCDQVSAYGFMTPDYRNYSDHYYDASYHPVGFFINHDLRMEMSLWQQLHEQHLIQLYMHK